MRARKVRRWRQVQPRNTAHEGRAASAVTASGQSATPPPAAARQLDELQAGAEKRLILERQKKAN